MVEHVECFQTESQIVSLMNGKDARYLRVELEERRSSKGVPAYVSVCPSCGATGGHVVGADLGKRSGVQVAAVRFAGSAFDFRVEIWIDSGDAVGPVVADVGQGIIGTGSHVDGSAAL